MSKKLFALITVIALVSQLLTPWTAPVQACGEKVCPPGDVKYDIGTGYEYTDGSATISGDSNIVYWSAADGCEITHVCIKIGGPWGGSLRYPDPSAGQAGPYQYGISHVVLETECEQPFCGDGIKNQPSEECDGEDGVPEHYTCTENCKLQYLPYCGDGIKNQPSEECDGEDGVPPHYTCTEDCKLSYEPYCGDGVKNQPSEECDGEDGVPEHYTCTPDCHLQYIPYCGDGIKNQAWEECDGTDGVPEHYVCTEDCTLEYVPYCGDGIKNQPSEECDGTDGVSPHYTCTEDCKLLYEPYCGDGIQDLGEQCDDGNNVNGDGCSSTCTEEELTTITACKWWDYDGEENGEDKDEPMSGVTVSLQKCEDVYDILDLQTEYPAPFISHECDNWVEVASKTTDEDGCVTFIDLKTGQYRIKLIEDLPLYELFSENLIELFIRKYGQTETVDFFNRYTCGDGILQTEFGEKCEDGNKLDGDGCSSTCQIEYCGDGIINNVNEKCDDGNTRDNDGCSATCQREVCGDGILQTLLGERCDDGNTEDGDGCSSICRIERVLGEKIEKKVLGVATGSSITTPLLMSFVLTSALYFTDLLRRKNLIRREEKLCERNIRDRFKDRF